MKAATLTDANSIVIDDRQRPKPDRDELLVEVNACGVCTTDIHMYSGSLTVNYPMTPGHESAGEVVEIGSEVDCYEAGDCVAINPSIPCNECQACKSGRENLCQDLTSLGGAAEHIIEGAFAEYVTVPAGNVEQIGDMDYRTAALAEPLGCCIEGVDQIDLTSGETVVVLGAGAIGLLLVQLLKMSGAGTILVSEPVDKRREAALEVGADHVFDPVEKDLSAAVSNLVGEVDIAIEAAGLPEATKQAHSFTGRGGRTLVFGVPPEEATIEISTFDLLFEEREIVGTYSLTPDTFARAVTLLQNGRIDVDTLVTDDFDLGNLENAFEQMKARKGLKKMVYPNG